MNKFFGWRKPKFDVSQYGTITIEEQIEHHKKWIEDFERGNYLEFLNCSLHASWPFVRPPRYRMFTCDSRVVAGLYGALTIMVLRMLVFEALSISHWQTYAVVVLGIPYAWLYRKQMKLHVAKRFRERILAQVPTA